MIIVGIDPGIKNTGVAIHNALTDEIKCEVINPFNLNDLYNQIVDLVTKHKPDIVVVEGTIKGFSKSPSSHLESRGAIIAALQKIDVDYRELTPPQWKKILFGKGNISKTEVYRTIKQDGKWGQKIKGLNGHEIDALCLTLAYIAKIS